MIADKEKVLENIIQGCGPMLISYSGGVDSTLLAVIARDVLGDKCRAVFLDSPLMPRAAVAGAKKIAEELKIPLDIIKIPYLENESIRKNPPDRCYHCKLVSAEYLKELAASYDLSCIADGMNVSDTGEHRPGLVAASEEGIVHPFIMAGITKDEIRRIARDRGLPVWNKPSAACLASRVPYGEEITISSLRKIEASEAYLSGKGFRQSRVRLHGQVARIEVLPEDFEKLLSIRDEVVRHMKEAGVSYVTLDLAGYRSGSMDEVL